MRNIVFILEFVLFLHVLNNDVADSYRLVRLSNTKFINHKDRYFKINSGIQNNNINNGNSNNNTNPIKSDKLEDDDIDIDLVDINAIMASNYDNLDSDGFQQSIMDSSIQNAIKNYISAGPQPPTESPVEIFNRIYKDIKSTKGESKKKLDVKSMLESLFPQEKVKEPFDERKVLIKLRSILNQEDFAGMFKDPIVGEIL